MTSSRAWVSSGCSQLLNINDSIYEQIEPGYKSVNPNEFDSQDPLSELLDYDLIQYLENQDNKVEKPVHFNLSQAIIDDLFDKN